MVTERNELGRLESIVLFDLSAFIERKYKVDPDLLCRFKYSVNSEVERIKFSFVNSTAMLEKRRTLETFVQYHEHNIIRLANALTTYVGPTDLHLPNGSDPAILCQYLYTKLQELLTFIERHYPTYFDSNAWIPDNYHAIAATEFAGETENLREALCAKNISAELIEHTLAPYIQFTRSNTATYHRLVYLKNLQPELQRIADDKTVTDDIPLLWLLFDMNFNTVAYNHYLTARNREYYDKITDVRERVDRLSHSLKLIRQRVTVPGCAFDPNNTPLQDQLIRWMELEINYHRGQLSPAPAPADPEIDSPGERLKVNLSVAHLAYLLHLFVASATLQPGNITTLIKKVSRIFETRRTDDISEKSFENRYYGAEHNTKQSIRKLLLDLVKRIDNDL